MPRIDPIQLLNCLSVLLSPQGGIRSREEVQRLALLMTKYSKKLVSKCIYVQILKCTETDLLGLFMGSEGWLLVHVWLTESIVAKNWPLVKELLELLLLCPVDIERLKTNNCPKLVKELSKDDDHYAIKALASKLVEQWLKTVKGEQVVPVQLSDLPLIIKEAYPECDSVTTNECDVEKNVARAVNDTESKAINEEEVKSEKSIEIEKQNEVDEEPETLPVLKICLKDGKQVITQVDDDNESKTSETLSDSEKPRDKSKSRSKDKEDRSSSRSSSSSKHSSRSHSSSKEDKHKSSHKSSSSRRSSSSSSSSKDKSKDKDKDKHSSHSSKSKSDSSRKSSDKSSSSSSKSKDDRHKSTDKDKSKEKDEKSDKKENLNKSTEKTDDKVPSVHKLGKIPKLSDVKKEKPSISIEVRKPDEPKPKTVKTFHSKFRKHGLEEEVKPPPSRAAVLTKKSTPVLPPTVSIPKRPSPVHSDPPPEKKPKIVEPVEKPGAIKLIPPKPKHVNWWWQVLPLMSPSVYNSLGCVYVSEVT